MKVALITSGYFPVPPSKGGAVEALVQYLIEQNEKRGGLELIVYSCDDPNACVQAEVFSRCTFRFVRTPAVVRGLDRLVYFVAKNVLRKQKHMSYRYIFQRLHFIWSAGRGLAAEPVDRVVFENSPTLLMSMRVAGNKERYADRCIYHMHNVVPGLFGCEEEIFSCRRVFGVSRYTLGELKGLANGRLDDSKLFVLKNRVDESIFTGRISDERASELRTRHGVSSDAKVVLFGGRLTPEKGALELVEAFSRLRSDNVVLLVLGSYYYGSEMRSEYEEKLAAAAESLGDSIVFTGFIDHADMPDYYALADVVCAPSVWSDSAPLAVIEPLTAGRPLITTEMGGIPEYATDGVDSVVLPVDDQLVHNLAEAIDSILGGEIVLRKSDAAGWRVSSFYDDFVRLVSE